MNKDPLTLGKEVIKTIKKSNHEAYFVGGCVRDLLLQKNITDIDIATSATPEDIIELFENVIPIGIDHGTVLVRYKKTSFEITTYRVDGLYSNQRHPDNVQYIKSIDEDLKRRDFTINALAMDENNNIIDLFNGQADLTTKTIRAVGNAKERFLEDPLRMVRAIRFSSQLGFTIEDETLQQINELKANINTIAVERLTEEMRRCFAGKYLNKGIDYLMESKVYYHLPILKENTHLMSLFPKRMIPLKSISEIISLFHLLDQSLSIASWIKGWKCSNQSKREARQLVLAIGRYNQNKNINPLLIYELSNELYSGFSRLIKVLYNKNISVNYLNEFYNQLPIKSPKELAINGADLIELFPHLRTGRWIQEMLQQITEQVLFTKLPNNKNILKEWILCNPPKNQ